MHPTGKLVHLHAMYTKTGIFAVCKYNILRDPSYMRCPAFFFTGPEWTNSRFTGWSVVNMISGSGEIAIFPKEDFDCASLCHDN